MTPAILSALPVAVSPTGGIGLFGGGVLLHPLGLSVAVSEIEPAALLPEVMRDARPVLHELILKLNEEGLDTKGLVEARAALNGSDGGLRTRQAFSQLTRTLESYTEHLPAYQRAADLVAQTSDAFSALRFDPVDVGYHQKLKDLHRLTSIRELLARETANKPKYEHRFRETYLIASGGQAFVHHVEELDQDGNPTGRQFVARKLKKTESIARLYDYAQATSRLDHPHIVKTHEVIAARYDSGESDLILIMEAIDGESLDWHLKNETKFSESDLLQILAQQLSALDHAHAKGVIHRDVKPSNVMLRRGENENLDTTLIDFGIAKLEGERTRDSSLGKGTIDWLSPEQICGNEISEATDYHGLGLLLLSLAMGKTRQDRVDFQKPKEDLEKLQKMGFSESFLKIIEGLTAEDPQTRRKTAQKVRSGMGLTGAMIPAGASLTGFPQAFPEIAYPSSEEAIKMLVERYPSEHSLMGALQLCGVGLSLGGTPASWVVVEAMLTYGWEFLGISFGFIGLLTSLLSASVFTTLAVDSWFGKRDGNKIYLRNGGYSFGPKGGESLTGKQIQLLENPRMAIAGTSKGRWFTNEFILKGARRMSKNEIVLEGEIGGERMEVKLNVFRQEISAQRQEEIFDYPPGFCMHLVGKFDEYGFFIPTRFGPAFRTQK